MRRRPPRSTLFPTRRSSDLPSSARAEPLVSNDQRIERQDAAGIDPQRIDLDLLDPRVLAQKLPEARDGLGQRFAIDRKSTRLNSSHVRISYAVFCLKKKKHK